MPTDDGDQKTDKSGTASLSGKSLNTSEVLDIVSDAAGKVIPLLITSRNAADAVWNAEVVRRYKNGSIRRIYMWYTIRQPLKPKDIISNVKDTFRDLSGHFSVVSQNNGRALICVSYLNPRITFEGRR